MQRRTIWAACVASGLALPVLAAATSANPDAGQQARSIKALSDEDIAALRKGEGMGMAKVAELNGYPGPAHVLTLAQQIGITQDQLQRTQTIYDRMNASAKSLGAEVIARERNLDQLFAIGQATENRLMAETKALGELQGQLRAVHLAAHLEMRVLLTPEQIASYQKLRGYGNVSQPPQHHHAG
jgi:Spy/CpxP family protein refolding chaperone